jgi:hypothetical protein
VGTAQSQLLLSVGQDVNATQRREGIKIEVFDVRDIAHPQSIGAEVFGRAGTWSDALNDPHALSFVELPGTETRYRLALPIRVYETTGVLRTARTGDCQQRDRDAAAPFSGSDQDGRSRHCDTDSDVRLAGARSAAR